MTVGIVTPHQAPGPEVELPAVSGGRIVTLVSRTAHGDLRASTEPTALERTAEAFRASALTAVAHASTTTSYVIGHREEAELIERLSRRLEVPATTSGSAAAAALRTHGVRRVQLVHPPWFEEDFDELGPAYFRGQGFDPVVTRAAGLSNDPARVKTQQIVDWVERNLEDRTEAVFFAGNGFRTAAAVEELERRTGRLVVSVNQALLWGLLRATGTSWDITGYGRLLRTGTSPT